jgi:ketosteroid isomerase-like protein
MSRVAFFMLGLFCAVTTGVTRAASSGDPAREVSALLAMQSAAWSRGDIDGFMQGYAQTDDLRFASGGTITRGWRATLERYKQRYSDKSAMGTLSFQDLEITVLGSDGAIAFGRWKLTREKDAPHGLFTLTLKKFPTGWQIVQDHTSSAP